MASNQRTYINKGLAVRQAGGASQHRDRSIKMVRDPAVGTSQQAAQSTEAMGSKPGELTPGSQHHETVSNPGVGTREQKAHIPMGMGTLQECPGITGLTSENVGSPAVRA